MKLKKCNVFFPIMLLLCSINTFSWDATGHVVVAEIAYQHLTPTAKYDVNFLIEHGELAKVFPHFTPYVYAAPWPDYLSYDIKASSSKVQPIFKFMKGLAKSWHYIDDPIILNVPKNTVPKKVSVNNSVWAIQYLIKNLQDNFAKKSYDMATLDLIFLTHIVGDVHQPLHNATLYSPEFPIGDVGGNLYHISGVKKISELHALWDESLGRFDQGKGFSPNAGYRPSKSQLQRTAHEFSQLCNQQADLSPNDWEKQSHKIAVNFVYPIKNILAPKVNGPVSKRYIYLGQQIAAKQMCRAGKRLSIILNRIFKQKIGVKYQ